MPPDIIDNSELPEVLELDQDGKTNWLVTKVALLDQRLSTMYTDWKVMAPPLKVMIADWKTIKTKAIQGIMAAIGAVVGINFLI